MFREKRFTVRKENNFLSLCVCVLAERDALFCPNNPDVLHLLFGSGAVTTDGTFTDNCFIWSEAYELKRSGIFF